MRKFGECTLKELLLRSSFQLQEKHKKMLLDYADEMNTCPFDLLDKIIEEGIKNFQKNNQLL